MEISGAMSAQEYGYYEPELLISSDATALGVALHGQIEGGASIALAACHERSRRDLINRYRVVVVHAYAHESRPALIK